MENKFKSILLWIAAMLYTCLSIGIVYLIWDKFIILKVAVILGALFGFSRLFAIYKLKTEFEINDDWFIKTFEFCICTAGLIVTAIIFS